MNGSQAARTADQIEADSKAEREEMRIRWAREDAIRASGQECDARTEAAKLRHLADSTLSLARDAKDAGADAVSYNEAAQKLLKKANELDPPKPEPHTVRETMHIWFIRETSDGLVHRNGYHLAEPPKEVTEKLWILMSEAFGKQAHRHSATDHIERMRVLRREVFSSLTHELGCRIFNTQGTPDGRIWAEAMAMFEKYRDGDSTF